MNPLLSLNITNIQDVTAEQFNSVANKVLATPELIIFYLISIFVFLVVGLLFLTGSSNKKSRMLYFGIWALCSVVVGVILLIFIYNPNVMASFTNNILNFFNNK